MPSPVPASWSGLTPLAVSGKEEPTSVATEVKQRNNRVIVLVGVVIALVAFGLSLYISHNGSSNSSSSGSTVPVAVAKTDLIQGSQITSDAISIAQYPQSQVPAGYSPDGASVLNKFIAVGVSKNTPLTASLLVADANSAKQAALTVQPLDIHPGYVAIAIPADGGGGSPDKASPDIVSVGGWFQPEDHIDMIIDTGQGSVRYAFQDVRVLKVGTNTGAAAGGASAGATVFIVELPRAQAEEVAYLIAKKTDLQGNTGGQHILSYVLRGVKDKGTTTGSNYLDDADPNVPAKKDAPVNAQTFNALFPGK
jgi:Flp pilus assembly protein CpaB